MYDNEEYKNILQDTAYGSFREDENVLNFYRFYHHVNNLELLPPNIAYKVRRIFN